mgnify:CR=1 FL=1
MNRNAHWFFVGMFFSFIFAVPLKAQSRQSFMLEKNWKFSRDKSATFMNETFNDSQWQNVTVPHDWAIYGPFSPNNDSQHVAIAQDGQTEATEHAGRTGGLPFVGEGFYRTQFEVPGFKKGKRVQLVFDGAMANAQVFVNGKKAGEWAYGYNTFHFDVTDLLHEGKNTLAVQLMNRPEQSRWYPGAGLYRNVHVVVTDEVHIPIWGTYVTTPVVRNEFAKVNVKTKISNAKGNDRYVLETIIRDSRGQKVSSQKSELSTFDEKEFEQSLVITNPKC